MVLILLGGLCALAIFGFVVLSIASFFWRLVSGGGYARGGYQGAPPGRWGMGWGGGYAPPRHHAAPHHPKPAGGGFKLNFGGQKPSAGYAKHTPHFGGGGAHKKW